MYFCRHRVAPRFPSLCACVTFFSFSPSLSLMNYSFSLPLSVSVSLCVFLSLSLSLSVFLSRSHTPHCLEHADAWGWVSGVAHTFFSGQTDKPRAGELMNVLREAGQEVPADLLRFGSTVKKKESKLYGAHFKDVDTSRKAVKVTFDSDDE